MTRPGYDDVARAAARLEGLAHRTPVMTCAAADARAGARLFFKCENFQRTGSFKFRGAANAVSSLSPAARARGVVTFSSGNHAQAVALAASLAGIAACVVMPHDAPLGKVEATRAHGARLVRYDRYAEDREAIARGLAEAEGMTLIPPFDDALVIAGQGTATAELIAQAAPLDSIVVCLGGGGLLSGAVLAAGALAPGCRVYGVEPAAGNDGQMSLRQGRRVRIEVPVSIADGALTQMIGAIPFAIMHGRVADVVTVTDDDLRATMRFLAERMKIVVEPTGCLAAAAVLTGALTCKGRVGVILSGGNTSMLCG